MSPLGCPLYLLFIHEVCADDLLQDADHPLGDQQGTNLDREPLSYAFIQDIHVAGRGWILNRGLPPIMPPHMPDTMAAAGNTTLPNV
ncbi:MAG: hypothetical protein U0236_08890 [Nitrospira sp.]